MSDDKFSTYRDDTHRIGSQRTTTRKIKEVNLSGFKKVSLDKAYPKVKEYILSFPVDQVFSKEQTARVLQINISIIEQCFKKLNLEGILSQAERKGSRSFLCDTNYRGWHPDKYTKLKE